MNKHDIVEKIAKEAGITKTTAAAAVQSFINAVTKSLKKGDSVSFVGFGTFKTANRKARTALNPQTGAADPDSEAPRAPLLGRQGSQAGGPLNAGDTLASW